MDVSVPFTLSVPTTMLWTLDIRLRRNFLSLRKSPHRFVPLTALRNVRVEKPKTMFVVIAFDTDQEPFRIGEMTPLDNRAKNLPFLNYLIDRLKQIGWSDSDLAPLHKLQRIIQGELVPLGYFIDGGWATLACYLAPVFCVFPLYPFIFAIPYPAIVWIAVFCGLVICLIGYALNSRLESWKNKKIDEKLHALSEG
jgi:hypothetical protein